MNIYNKKNNIIIKKCSNCNCKLSKTKVYKCDGCNNVLYCSKQCKKQDRKKHIKKHTSVLLEHHQKVDDSEKYEFEDSILEIISLIKDL